MVFIMDIGKVTVIIPAYKPDAGLLSTLSEAAAAGFRDILVVDDGSGEEYASVFEKAASFPECTVLRHTVNRGKGAALKTAMAYFLENRPEQAGVVTADADGQHLASDIAAVSGAMSGKDAVVLGVRDFSDPSVPFKSKAGNRITSVVFRLFFGMKLSDTQTGLRAIPREVLPEVAAVKGERYEYETQMFFCLSRRRTPIKEVKIQTVYLEGNSSSHFRPVRDSIRIYSLILKYLFSSAAAAVIDAAAFFLFKSVGLFAFLPVPLTWSSAIAARVISSLTNFLINARAVFGDKPGRKTFVRYYLLAALQIALSTVLLRLAEHAFSVSAPALSTLMKALIDTFLFFFSFRIQHKWVFNSRDRK